MNRLNPISESIKRNEVDTLINVLLADLNIDISAEDKAAFKNIINELPIVNSRKYNPIAQCKSIRTE